MDALETLFTRRSVRRFRPDPVERSEIEKIIEAGRLAATTKEKIGGKLGKIGENWGHIPFCSKPRGGSQDEDQNTNKMGCVPLFSLFFPHGMCLSFFLPGRRLFGHSIPNGA